MKTFLPYTTFLAAVLILPLTGCGPSQEAAVSGTVTLNGEVLPTGVVSFHPVDKGPIGNGPIEPDGSYTLRTGNQPGIPAGEYIVTVVAYGTPPAGNAEMKPPLLTPRKYADKSQSDLRYQVKPGSNRIDLELTK